MPQTDEAAAPAVDQLLAAATVVGEVAAGLDRTYTMCAYCKHRHYADWTAFQVGKQLDATVLKLRKLADELGRKAPGLEAHP